MHGKKYKRSKKYVETIYEKAFGIRQPYQILVDADFCLETLKWKIAPLETLVTVFGGQVKPSNTEACSELPFNSSSTI